MEFKPHDYQNRFIQFLMVHPRNYGMLDMGLGKTVSTLTAFAYLKEQGIVSKMLVVAPLRVIYNVWPKEVEKWDHLRHLRVSIVHGGTKVKHAALLTDDADIYVINYDGMPWLRNQWRYVEKKFDWIVFDESSMLKSHSTIRFKAAREMARDPRRRLTMLSGTPAPNGLHELWSQFFLLDHGKRLEPGWIKFRTRFMEQLDYHGYNWRMKKGAAEYIYSAISDITMRLDAKDYLQMPDIVYNDVRCSLPEKLLEQYRELEKEMFLQLDEVEVEAFNAAALTMKCRQFVQGFLYSEETPLELHTVKLDALEEIVHDNGAPTLVAYSFVHDLKLLQTRFPNAPVIGGGTSPQQSKALVEAWNRGELPVLFAHPQSLSHGVNMQEGGANIVWYGLTFSLEQYQQFNARLHRQGQTRPVIVHNLVVENTIDEAMMRALRTKDGEQRSLLNALKEYRNEQNRVS